MASSTIYLSKFKENMIIFLDEMVDTFNFPEFIIFRVMINNIAIDIVMTEFIKHVLPNKQKVTSRTVEFFKTLSNLTTKEINNTILCIYRIVISETIDKETKEVIWKWFDQFIILSEKYVSSREAELLK